ncbi:MAG TPA: hypothetical protein VF519_12095 [Mycobacteriales bacterium]|jgi:hypothetical protein
MRALLAPALLAVAAALPAAPAGAAAPPVPTCATFLAAAASGASSSCYTEGLPPMGNNSFGAYRTVYVVVAGGAVQATLSCSGGGPSGSATVTSTASFGGWGGGVCTLTLTALQAGTSAVATSIGTYVYYG